ASRTSSLLSPRLFFTHPPPPEISTLSLHDALPICSIRRPRVVAVRRLLDETGVLIGLALVLALFGALVGPQFFRAANQRAEQRRSEEHTSELQSLTNLVCRLLLEKKHKTTTLDTPY